MCVCVCVCCLLTLCRVKGHAWDVPSVLSHSPAAVCPTSCHPAASDSRARWQHRPVRYALAAPLPPMPPHHHCPRTHVTSHEQTVSLAASPTPTPTQHPQHGHRHSFNAAPGAPQVREQVRAPGSGRLRAALPPLPSAAVTPVRLPRQPACQCQPAHQRALPEPVLPVGAPCYCRYCPAAAAAATAACDKLICGLLLHTHSPAAADPTKENPRALDI